MPRNDTAASPREITSWIADNRETSGQLTHLLTRPKAVGAPGYGAEVPETSAPTQQSEVARLLEVAVAALGGEHRAGQLTMAEEVVEAFGTGRHLLVQAGTGTGKSLAYLVPALVHDSRVVIATATLALQHQLVERDLPRLVDAVGASETSTRRTPS